VATLSLEHVSKRFGEATVLNDLSLKVEDGEFLVMLGPSGSGKTTCLRLIAGLEDPDSGSIVLDGQRIVEVAPRDRAVAFCRQSYALYPHLTAYENLAFWPRKRNLPPEDIDRRVNAAAELVALRELLTRKPRQLTGGQRMRLALARTLVQQPKVFLLDEPLFTLDAKLRLQTRPELIKLRRKLGMTVLYATTDTTEAMSLGDRIAVLRNGVLQQLDTPQALYEQPANMFVAGFVGSPAINFLRSELRTDAGELVADAGPFQITPPALLAAALRRLGQPSVYLGIRPQHLYDREWAPSLPNLQPIRLRVEVVERLGSELIVSCAEGIVARLDARASVRAGDTADLLVDTAQLHAFDPITQRAVM